MRLRDARAPLLILCLALPFPVLAQSAAGPRPIQDNSFLVEEAYNQEPGVIQHISTFMRARKTGLWEFTFTEEWPAPGQRHQISLTVPVARVEAGPNDETAVGDVLLNYRLQLVGSGETKTAFAPRLSLVLPTGDETKGAGSGSAGVQVNLPLSVTLSPRFVSHLNAGATLTPSAKNEVGDEASAMDYNASGSLIFLAHSNLNVMLELAWGQSEFVTGPDATANSRSLLLAPGVRGAIDFESGLQIVPGIAVPIGLGPSKNERYLFFYLSFEHPLWRP